MNDLRDDPTFEAITEAGRCWKCGGPVVAYFNHGAFDHHRYPSVCFTRVTSNGFLRDCANVSPIYCALPQP